MKNNPVHLSKQKYVHKMTFFDCHIKSQVNIKNEHKFTIISSISEHYHLQICMIGCGNIWFNSNPQGFSLSVALTQNIIPILA